jgi:N-acetylglucosamine-6-phosphate deacetylase
MTMLAIVDATLVDPPHPPYRGIVLLEGSHIRAAGPATDVAIPDEAEIVDAGGGYVVPGFVDVHVHGGDGSDFMDGTPDAVRTVCRFHAAGGTTGLLATTAAAPTAQLRNTLSVLAQVQREGTGGALILGAHLEGPYFSPAKHGCHLPAQIRPPRSEEYEPLLDAYPGLVRWVTLAPEVEGALDLIVTLRGRGIVAAAGHTEAAEPELRQAMAAGLRHATHLYCAMSTIQKDGPRRIPGLLEVALASDALSTEVIADGHHLAPTLLRIAVKAKGPERLLLVTDAMRGAGMPDGTYTFGPPDGSLAIVENGVARTPDNTGFASSTVQTCDLVRNMVELAGCSLSEAVQMASRTPAEALGLGHRKGRLRAGYDADVVLMDAGMRVRRTIVAGKAVFSV